MKKTLLHIVDMQNDFVHEQGALSVPGAAELIAPANRFLESAHFDRVVATMDSHVMPFYTDSEEGKLFPPHCLVNQWGWQPAINIPNAILVKKGQFDVWATPRAMDAALAGLTPRNTDVFIMGVASDYCVKFAIAGYLARGFQVTVIDDLCRGIDRQMTDVVDELNHEKLRLINARDVLKQQGK